MRIRSSLEQKEEEEGEGVEEEGEKERKSSGGFVAVPDIYIYIHTRIYPSRVPLVKNDRSFESVVARTADSTPARILRIVSIYNGGGI